MTKASKPPRLVTFETMLTVEIGDVRCGFPVERVSEVVPAARPDPLPGAPEAVMGVLNVRGTPVVLVDGHRCLDRMAPPLRPTDRFVLLDAGEPSVAIRVDRAHDLREVTGGDAVSELPLGPQEAPHTVALLPDGVLLVRDPATFVTAADAAAIRTALHRVHRSSA